MYYEANANSNEQIVEWCPHCDIEVLLTGFKKQACPNCGVEIFPCAACASNYTFLSFKTVGCQNVCPFEEDNIKRIEDKFLGVIAFPRPGDHMHTKNLVVDFIKATQNYNGPIHSGFVSHQDLPDNAIVFSKEPVNEELATIYAAVIMERHPVTEQGKALLYKNP